MSIEAPALRGRRAGWSWSTVGAYVALTKPRIIELLLVTTLPTMVVAQRGLPPVWLMAATLAGGALAAGGANAINMVVDRDIDRLMNRTKNRPLVTGAMTPTAALVFALVLEVAAFVELWLAVNLLSAVLAISATLFYVFVYTLWLKRRSTQNIVIGGAAGAVPVLVGWAAVTDSLAWAPVVLFAIIFIWTPPHFWSLAVRYKEDYRAADVPMLPVVASMKRTTTEIVYYTVALVAVSFVFGPVAHLGWIYMITAAVLGAGFLYLVTRLWGLAQNGRATGRDAMKVFGYSITYLTVLFVAMAGDVLISQPHSLASRRHDRRTTPRPGGPAWAGAGRRTRGGPHAPQAVHPHRPGHRPPDHRAHRALHQHRKQPERGWCAARRGAGAVVHAAPTSARAARPRSRCRPTGVATGRRRCCCSSGPGVRAATRSSLPWPPPCGARSTRAARCRGSGSSASTASTGPRRPSRSSTSAGVTFPVASDPQADITSGSFYFDGDPYAVFVKGDGTISKIVRGAVLTPSSLAADERALIPSGT